jgi:hypothetical protein
VAFDFASLADLFELIRCRIHTVPVSGAHRSRAPDRSLALSNGPELRLMICEQPSLAIM